MVTSETTYKIQVYQDASGHKVISRLQSMAAWRMHLGKPFAQVELPLDERGLCSYCQGHGYLRAGDYGLARCICTLIEEEKNLREELAPYQSARMAVALSQMQIWPDESIHSQQAIESRAELKALYDFVRKWKSWPYSWLTIYGGVGSGKSMLLQALSNWFGPWALYVTMDDFYANCFTRLSDGTLDEMIRVMRLAPIILVDDLGSDYNREGKDFVRKNMAQVVKFRYEMWLEYPTVITTNLPGKALIEYDPRVADRILDSERVQLFSLAHVLSWRRYGPGAERKTT